jgi:hypothetical protein
VPTEWITETRYKYDIIRDYMAAEAAMETHLPQYMNQRAHFNVSHVHGRTGIGFGYAYMLDNDNNAGVTFSMGHAGGETAARASFGFEFGGDRPMRFDLSHLEPAAAPTPEPEPIPAGMVLVYADELEDLQLMADSSEDIEEHIEQTEYRYAQQQSLLEELQREHDDDEAEIEQLKQEAAALRKRQESDEALRESVRQRILEKRKGDEKGDT